MYEYTNLAVARRKSMYKLIHTTSHPYKLESPLFTEPVFASSSTDNTICYKKSSELLLIANYALVKVSLENLDMYSINLVLRC